MGISWKACLLSTKPSSGMVCCNFRLLLTSQQLDQMTHALLHMQRGQPGGYTRA